MSFLNRQFGFWLFGTALLSSSLVLLIPASRAFVLQSVGRVLVLERAPVQSADVIVVAIDADGAGVLEAADLAHAGVSSRVAVFGDPPTSVDREFLRRGLPYEDMAAVSIRELGMLGVSNVERIPRSVSGSEQEGIILPGWCESHGYHSVALVASADHSRRLDRILRRSLAKYAIRVTVQASPYSEFDPNGWWKSRAGVRDGIIELEKLTLDFVRHPFS